MGDTPVIAASFVLAQAEDGLYACVTHPGAPNGVGIPGGKKEVVRGTVELSWQTAIREAAEEGWLYAGGVSKVPLIVQERNGKWLAWHVGHDPYMLEDYKEKHRIQPLWLTEEQLRASGWGNPAALDAYLEMRMAHG